MRIHLPKRERVSMEQIETIVCNDYSIESSELRNKSRVTDLSNTRHVIMAMAREFTGLGFDSIAAYYGQHYSSAIWASKKIREHDESGNDAWISYSEGLRAKIAKINDELIDKQKA